jgi:hypothetical protein
MRVGLGEPSLSHQRKTGQVVRKDVIRVVRQRLPRKIDDAVVSTLRHRELCEPDRGIGQNLEIQLPLRQLQNLREVARRIGVAAKMLIGCAEMEVQVRIARRLIDCANQERKIALRAAAGRLCRLA